MYACHAILVTIKKFLQLTFQKLINCLSLLKNSLQKQFGPVYCLFAVLHGTETE